MKPSKRHDGQRITIAANATCIDAGVEITGEYHHVPRKPTFRFVYYTESFSRCTAVLSRDEWDIVERGAK